MSKSTAAAKGFLGSLVLLAFAIIVFFVVVFPKGKDPVVPPPARDKVAAEVATENRRQAIRSAPTRGSQAFDEETQIVPGAAPSAPDGDAAVDLAGEDPEEPEIQRAINLVDAGNVSEATQVLDGVLKRDPKNEQALVEMAMIQLLDLKQTDAAVGYLQRVIEVNASNQIALSELVSLYEEQNKVEEGLSFMQDVAAKNPSSPELSHGVGQMLTLAGRDQEAIQYYERATASPEFQVRAYRDLAEAYSKTGEPDKAIDSYGKAVHEQELEIEQKAAKGLPVQFAEERLAYTKLDMARQMLQTGDVEKAEQILEEIDAVLPGDETIAAMRDTIRRKKAG